MTREYDVTVEGRLHRVVISDEKEALLAAKAAGKASVSLWSREGAGETFLTRHAVESLDDATGEYLEKVVRRELGLPWEIAETRRLRIREFQAEDSLRVIREPGDGEDDRVFWCRDHLEEYIRWQYGLWGYGLWALWDRRQDCLVGKAGVTVLQWESGEKTAEGLELGYHIFTPFRRKGYAREACEGILMWCQNNGYGHVYAKTDASNEASVRLLKSLGFRLIDQRCSGSGRWHCLYGADC